MSTRPTLRSDTRASLERTIARRRGLAGQLLNPSDVDRFEATARAIPNDVQTVLDAGCGLGVLTDCLADLGYVATGADIDEKAMSAMIAPHVTASIAALPFDDRRFDVVIANEVLEHLPEDVFEATRMELGRVAESSVVVTVPNTESLESATTKCPACTCIYSLHGHVRRFDRATMGTLIPGFRLASISTVGPFKARHRTVEWFIRRRLLGRWPSRPGVDCPQCGHRQPGSPTTTELGAGGGSWRRALRLVAGVPWDRWWFVAVYRRDG